MKILDRYIVSILLKTTALALLSLLILFAFLSLIDQFEETGRGNYTTLKAMLYVFLTMPRLVYELVPIATVIGSMTTLGLLAHHSELVVMRTAGLSLFQISAALARGGILIGLFAVITGELIAPYGEQTAQHMRSVALSEQITLKTRNGFWSRDGLSFINIRKILPGDRLEEIYIYEFDADSKLRVSTYAKRANYQNKQWLLEDIRQSVISPGRVENNRLDFAAWDSLLNPEVINMVSIRPEYLTLWGLVDYIRYLKTNSQDSRQYEQAFWSKLIYPLIIIMMAVLSAPLVTSYHRMVAVSQRVFTGCLIGIGFHILNQVSGQMGLVYSIPPLLSTTLPIMIAGSVIIWFIQRDV